MSWPQTLTFWTVAVLYTASSVFVFVSLAWSGKRARVLGVGLAWAGAVAHVVALGVRWSESGHFPYVGNYEGALFGALLVVAGYLIAATVRPSLAPIGAVCVPAALITLGWGLVQDTGITPVTSVYRSAWLIVHFTFAWSTYAVYLVVAGMAVVILLRLRAERRGIEPTGALARTPEPARLDEMSLRLVGFGFLMNAITLASGSIWAYRLWGSYWSWDPVETWTLLTWLAYGFYLHARLTLRWNRRRLAWVALFALFGVSMATWGVQLVPNSYHLFRDLGATMMEETSRPR